MQELLASGTVDPPTVPMIGRQQNQIAHRERLPNSINFDGKGALQNPIQHMVRRPVRHQMLPPWPDSGLTTILQTNLSERR